MKNSGPFDPSALERAAAALRELNQSPHAAKALDAMIKTDEAKSAEYRAKQKGLDIEKIKVESQEKRQNMETQKKNNKEIANYNDTLERKRWVDKLQQQEESSDKIRRENEESLKRQEEIRRETISFQMKKQQENEEKKLILESNLKEQGFRKNFDLHQKESIVKLEQERLGRLDVHNLYLKNIRDATNYLMVSKEAAWTLAKYSLMLSGAYFLSKNSLQVLFRQIEAKINKPSLVRETSRYTIANFHKIPFHWLQSNFKSTKEKQNSIFSNIILNPQLQQNLKVISSGMINKRLHNGNLRNFLFYGQPGTGKTLFAKLIATQSGLHYAVVSGGDIEKLGPQAATEVDKLFRWAQSTKRGTIIFIDEAESVFYRREQHQNQATSNALATLLAQTSAPSSTVSLVIATNLPHRLDRAAIDRMDAVIEFGLQDSEQRKQMVLNGLNRICHQSSALNYLWNPSLLFFPPLHISHCLSEQFIDQTVVPSLNGYSARQIDKFINALHDEAFTLFSRVKGQSVITEELVKEVLNQSLHQFKVRENWVK